MNKAPMAQRYRIALVGDEAIVLTKATWRILKLVAMHPEISYREIVDATGLRLNTLMVYAQRLHRAGLVQKGEVYVESRMHRTLTIRKNVMLDVKVRHL